MKLYKYKNTTIKADNRWTAWLVMSKLYEKDEVVLTA